MANLKVIDVIPYVHMFDHSIIIRVGYKKSKKYGYAEEIEDITESYIIFSTPDAILGLKDNKLADYEIADIECEKNKLTLTVIEPEEIVI